MKKIFLLFILPFFASAQTSAKKIRVLFLGNSYTYVNNLPLLVHDLALSKGDSLFYDSYSPGGYTFNNHSTDANSLAKISLGYWDYVVLQAQSQEPSFPPVQVNAQTLPYAIKLDTLIKHYNPCAHTVFYETWGRKYGDQSNCAGYPPLCTYAGMQNRLRDSYKLFADTTHDLMAPVGEAFRLAIATNTLLELYQSDQSHPSLEGSYLAAAVFYETLFQKSVLTSTFNPGVASGTLTLLNQVAHQLVADSTDLTNISRYAPKATFTVSSSVPGAYHFQSGTIALTHHWSFGDGSFSQILNPNHNYTASGTYTVKLVLVNDLGCPRDSMTQTLVVSLPTGLSDFSETAISLFPNPCSNFLTINAGKAFENNGSVIAVNNVLGKCVLKENFTGTLNTSLLPRGLYYIKISNSRAERNSCFLKNE